MTLGRAVCGCSRGHGSPWQPPRQRVGTGAPAGPWCDRHRSFGTHVHTQPHPMATSTPGNSLPRGWMGQDQTWGPLLCLPATTVGTRWPLGWSQGFRDRDGDGDKGSGHGGHAPGGQEGVVMPRKVKSFSLACFSPAGIGALEAQGGCLGGCTPQQGPGAQPHTAPVPTAAHTGACGSNTQPR